MKLKLLEVLRDTLSFKESVEEFELLETEQGTPDQKRKKRDFADGPTPGEESVAAEGGLDPKERLGELLDGNIQVIQEAFGGDAAEDLIVRRFKVAGKLRACAIYITGMADVDIINDYVLRQAMQKQELGGGKDQIAFLMEDVIAISDTKVVDTYTQTIQYVLNGLTAVLVDGESRAIIVETPGFDRRNVDKPVMEKIVRGPQEGFVENLRTNLTLIHKILRTPDLICETHPLGGNNNLRCALVFRKGTANEKLLAEVRQRLSKVKMNYMVGEGMLEQLLEVRKHSPMPQVLSTERPDRLAALVMSGHVGIICDGSPYATVLPATFFTMICTTEDEYMRPVYGTLMRLVRMVGLLCSVLLPALYIALILYHPGIMPSELINAITESRRMIPLPVPLELIFMLFVFQLVKESGMRVPGDMGQALGVVGALVMGQAAVDANIVSTVVLIVVSVTGLGTYAIPSYVVQHSVVIFRLILIFAATMAGLPGIGIALTAILAYLCSLKSFGMPIFAPFAPKTNSNSRFFVRGVLKPDQGSEDYVNTEEG